jgi:hypothetical protein
MLAACRLRVLVSEVLIFFASAADERTYKLVVRHDSEPWGDVTAGCAAMGGMQLTILTISLCPVNQQIVQCMRDSRVVIESCSSCNEFFGARLDGLIVDLDNLWYGEDFVEQLSRRHPALPRIPIFAFGSNLTRAKTARLTALGVTVRSHLMVEDLKTWLRRFKRRRRTAHQTNGNGRVAHRIHPAAPKRRSRECG